MSEAKEVIARADQYMRVCAFSFSKQEKWTNTLLDSLLDIHCRSWHKKRYRMTTILSEAANDGSLARS